MEVIILTPKQKFTAFRDPNIFIWSDCSDDF